MARCTVPGVNHSTTPGARSVDVNPRASRVSSRPVPSCTMYASVEAVCRCGVPPAAPSFAGQL